MDGTFVTDRGKNWMLKVRGMESLGGTLGLTETVNSSTLASSSGSNNLDIHMQKNTEYGAMAILSASSYGNPNVIANGATTTGNKTGVKMYVTPAGGEWVAASKYSTGDFKLGYDSLNSKYINYYTYSSSSAKIGDALWETQNWHGGLAGNIHTSGMVMLARSATYATRHAAIANNASIFSWYDSSYDDYDYLLGTRAVMICGQGI